jgi:hypothetical protein
MDNRMKLLYGVSILMCAMVTMAAQLNTAPTATGEAPTAASPDAPAPVASQPAGAPGSNATASASGVWLMTWKNEKGDSRQATLDIQQKGEVLSGTANLKGGPVNGTFRLTGNLRGNRIVLSVKAYWHHASFSGTVDGSTMSGSTRDGRPWLAAKS